MEKFTVQKKSRIPPCVLTGKLYAELWRILGQEGEYIWQALVGTGQDLLGKQEPRPQEIVIEREALGELLATLPRIDNLQITAEFADRGTVSLSFRNYSPPGGTLIVAGNDPAWVASLHRALATLFKASSEPGLNRLYSRWGFGVIQTVLPLSLSFIFVMLMAGLIIPSSIRQSEFIWWVSAATMVATLWVAAKISDRLICYFLQKYPYIRWLS
ncbi:MAG: hypothetical protein P4N59_32340 [Negativicutes bacterium]|nr:hypothetical protein [Negativicutes bacterium]